MSLVSRTSGTSEPVTVKQLRSLTEKPLSKYIIAKEQSNVAIHDYVIF